MLLHNSKISCRRCQQQQEQEQAAPNGRLQHASPGWSYIIITSMDQSTIDINSTKVHGLTPNFL
jgi:RNA polymerase subunit RPABC4/transcription elongation factor Spt4